MDKERDKEEDGVEAKCPICGEVFEDGEWLGDWSDCCGYSWLDEKLEDAYVCEGCVESLHEYGSRLVYRDEHGRISVVFDERMYWFDASMYEEHDGLGEVMRLLEAIMKAYAWKSVDGWRGHYDSKADEVGGWVRAVEGWNDAFCGSTYVENVKEVMEHFKPLIVVFPRSSNLCVVYFDVWCLARDKGKVQRLIVPEDEAFSFSQGIYCKAL